MISLKETFKKIKVSLHEGVLSSYLPLLPFIRIDGEPMTLDNHYPMEPFFRLKLPRRIVFQCARQVGKSISLAVRGLLDSSCIPNFHTLFIQPRYDQIKRFSNNYVRTIINDSILGQTVFDPSKEQSILQRSFRNGSNMYFSYSLLDADRCRGFAVAKCAFDEAQDIQHEFIPIIGETMSAQTKYGFYQFSGTPKTIDNTLNVLFDESSKAEWIIKCGCGKHNIPNLDNDILKMIGKHTCICSKCGKPLDITTGNYVHANTKQINSFRGYHVSQITHPLHAGYPAKWAELLYKMETYPEAKFYNEILGEPCDEAVKPLTEGDIRKASNGLLNILKNATKERGKYDAVVMGVDWSGYGADNLSTTALAVVGIIPGSEIVHCIYCERFKSGLTPEEEARILVDYAHQFRITYFAHDFTGAGMIREATIVQRGYPAEQIIPFQIVHAPIAQNIINYYQPAQGGRHCYNIDKTRSLMVLFEMIKRQKVTLPDWEKNKGQTKDILRDLLNIIQETRETPRGGEFTLMLKSPNHTDDFAHALNFACAAIWHVRGRYPSLVTSGHGPTPEDMHLMDPQTANWVYE